jgi:apolipoprotein N-acyltransferase
VSSRVSYDYIRETTFYTRWGDWFVAICALLVLVGCVLGFRATS